MTKTSTVSCSVSFSQFMNHYFKDVLSLSVSTKINTVSLRPQRAFLNFLPSFPFCQETLEQILWKAMAAVSELVVKSPDEIVTVLRIVEQEERYL